MPDGHLTLAQAAAEAGVDPSSLRHAIRRRRLVATKWGRDWFVLPADLAQYLGTRYSDSPRTAEWWARRREAREALERDEA